MSYQGGQRDVRYNNNTSKRGYGHRFSQPYQSGGGQHSNGPATDYRSNSRSSGGANYGPHSGSNSPGPSSNASPSFNMPTSTRHNPEMIKDVQHFLMNKWNEFERLYREQESSRSSSLGSPSQLKCPPLNLVSSSSHIGGSSPSPSLSPKHPIFQQDSASPSSMHRYTQGQLYQEMSQLEFAPSTESDQLDKNPLRCAKDADPSSPGIHPSGPRTQTDNILPQPLMTVPVSEPTSQRKTVSASSPLTSSPGTDISPMTNASATGKLPRHIHQHSNHPRRSAPVAASNCPALDPSSTDIASTGRSTSGKTSKGRGFSHTVSINGDSSRHSNSRSYKDSFHQGFIFGPKHSSTNSVTSKLKSTYGKAGIQGNETKSTPVTNTLKDTSLMDVNVIT